MEGPIIHNKYKKTGQLSFHNDRLVQSAATTNQRVVLKSVPLAKSQSLLKQISNIKKLRSPNLNGCSHLLDSFKQNDRMYMVVPQYGRNLEQLKQKCNGRFSLKTSLMLGLQMLERIKYVHECGLMHGDIKPENFLVGSGKLKHKIFLIDFELAHPYIVQGKHINKTQKDHIDGTLRFLSISVNQGYPLARKDELESLLYCIVYFMKGDLPWVNLTHQTFLDAYQHIRKLKQTSEEGICQGCPPVFPELLKWVKAIEFDQQPDYDYLKNKLLALFKKNGYEMDYYYDWEFL